VSESERLASCQNAIINSTRECDHDLVNNRSDAYWRIEKRECQAYRERVKSETRQMMRGIGVKN
jgi:hypothetical protein